MSLPAISRLTVAIVAGLCLLTGCAKQAATTPPPRQAGSEAMVTAKAEAQRPKNPYGFNKVLTYETTQVDYGKLEQGEPVGRAISFKNNRSESVIIKDITTSCHCCKAMLSTFEIPPEGEGELNISLDPQAASERFSVLISVEYMNRFEIDRVQVVGQVVK